MRRYTEAKTSRSLTWFFTALAALLLTGCGETEETVTWQPADEQPDAAVQAAIGHADAAAADLGNQLMAALQAALADGGPSQAVGVCQNIAPNLAQQVGQDHGVRIGRTSTKRRNPDNSVPDWALGAVASNTAEPVAFVASDGRVARLRPISTMPLCVQCHGPRDQLAPAVRDALATAYPDDRATGFNVGDIRGYFWVETDTRD